MLLHSYIEAGVSGIGHHHHHQHQLRAHPFANDTRAWYWPGMYFDAVNDQSLWSQVEMPLVVEKSVAARTGTASGRASAARACSDSDGIEDRILKRSDANSFHAHSGRRVSSIYFPADGGSRAVWSPRLPHPPSRPAAHGPAAVGSSMQLGVGDLDAVQARLPPTFPSMTWAGGVRGFPMVHGNCTVL